MFGRGRNRGERGADRTSTRADRDHLVRFSDSHPGVEAYLEPATSVLGTSVVLVAPSGEWTRRRIGDAEAARRFAHQQAIPLYDATLTSYPPRMRAWTAAKHTGNSGCGPGLRGRDVPPR